MNDGTSEIRELAADLSVVSARMVGPTFSVFKQAGEAVAKDWAANARVTAGQHGKWYPDSISSESRVSTDIVVDVGPEIGKRQGAMGPGFEFGSRNQPPHLDGAKALESMEKRLPHIVDATIGHLLP